MRCPKCAAENPEGSRYVVGVVRFSRSNLSVLITSMLVPLIATSASRVAVICWWQPSCQCLGSGRRRNLVITVRCLRWSGLLPGTAFRFSKHKMAV